MRMNPTHVRCIAIGRDGKGRAWIFYKDDATAYLASNKLMAMSDDFAINYLTSMQPRENRRFTDVVELFVVRAKKRKGLLVHRIAGSAGMRQPLEQKRLQM